LFNDYGHISGSQDFFGYYNLIKISQAHLKLLSLLMNPPFNCFPSLALHGVGLHIREEFLESLALLSIGTAAAFRAALKEKISTNRLRDELISRGEGSNFIAAEVLAGKGAEGRGLNYSARAASTTTHAALVLLLVGNDATANARNPNSTARGALDAEALTGSNTAKDDAFAITSAVAADTSILNTLARHSVERELVRIGYNWVPSRGDQEGGRAGSAMR
jgi:hypothetical protein